MDSLSSAPGNRNGNKLLSAAFAIAASISGSVNAATAPTPKFTDEPAGSTKILDVAKAQQAILDMLPADHKSRPGIAAAIKSLEDGGNVQELTNLFIWAKTIVDSPMAPPAAKEKAKEILDILTRVSATEEQLENGDGVLKQPLQKPLPGSKEELEIKKREKLIQEMLGDFNKATREGKNWSIGSQGNQDVDIKGKSGKILLKYKERRGQQNIANKNAVGVISGRLVPGDYDFNINSSTDGVLWLLDSTGKCINIDGVAPEKGQERIPLAKGMQRIRIPANCTKFTIGFFTNPLMPEVIIDEISAKTIEESKVAGN